MKALLALSPAISALKKLNWSRWGLRTAVAVACVLSAVNVAALAGRQDKEQRLMDLLARCKPPPAGQTSAAGAPAATSGPGTSIPAGRQSPPASAQTSPASPHTPPGGAQGPPARPQGPPAGPQGPPAGAQGPPAGPRVSPPGPSGPQGPPDPRIQRICARNLFSPPAPPPAFQDKLIGVLGDEAIFQSGQAAKVGGMASGAKVLAIGPNWAEVEFQGRSQRLEVWTGELAGASPAGGPGGPPPPGARGGPPMAGAVIMMPGGPPGMPMPPTAPPGAEGAMPPATIPPEPGKAPPGGGDQTPQAVPDGTSSIIIPD